MKSQIIQIAATYLMPFLLVLSLVVFYRGHNEPGGGFIGGLIGGSAIILYAGAYGLNRTKKLWITRPTALIWIGLSLALLSGFVAFLTNGNPFMTAAWMQLGSGIFALKLGTPLLFDLGVYLTVMGMLVKVVLAVMEEVL